MISLRKIRLPSDWLISMFQESRPMDQICTACGHVGVPERKVKGADEIERAIWIAAIVMTILYVPWGIYLQANRIHIPMIPKAMSLLTKVLLASGVIYTVVRWLSAYTACPKCSHPAMIPLDSPRAREIVEKYHAKKSS